MKVLHILPDLQLAGAQTIVVNILQKLDKRKFDCYLCILYSSSNKILEKKIQDAKIPIFYLGKHRGFDPRIIGRIDCLIKRIRPDIVHTHTYIMPYVILPAVINRTPIKIHTTHTMADREVGYLGKTVHWIAYNFFKTYCVGVSLSVAESIKNIYSIGAYTIYNGVEIKGYALLKKTSRSKAKKIRLLNVGGFRPVKNHELLINAFAQATRQHDDLELTLIGDGPLQGKMKCYVEECGLERKVIFLGEKTNVAELFGDYDIYVSSSSHEGFGLTIVEAMASSKPVIATAVDGIKELVDDCRTGILVSPGNVDELANAMIEMARRPDVRMQFGLKGREKAMATFNILKTIKKYESLYLWLHHSSQTRYLL